MEEEKPSFDITMYLSRLSVRFQSAFRTMQEKLWSWRIDRLKSLNKRTRIVSVFILAFLVFVYAEMLRPPAAFPEEDLVTIAQGQTLEDIANHLHEQSVVRSPNVLEMLVRLRGAEESVHAGDYVFKYPRSVFSVARIISVGAFGLEPVRITIPEGATIADMAIIYDRRLLAFDPEAFFLQAIDLEGYLFPDTYHFLPNVTEEEVISVMRDTFERKIAQFLPSLADSEYSLDDIVTMASLIEKEATNDKDRRLISGVLWNRMERGMLLQVDATFVYTHGKGTYGITLAELRDASNPYNTYVHKGLPPGPIAAPSVSSLNAALNPIENDYFFYLADREGVTYFSETYEEHLVKKRQYVD